jgi:hypothetical protein
MPFGLKNAPKKFSRMMHQLFRGVNFVKCYLDDITIHSNTFEEHVQHVNTVLDILKKANLKLNHEKCSWFTKTIHVLGYIVKDGCYSIDPKRTEAISQRLSPRSVNDLQKDLGLVNHYKQFIPQLAHIAAPLFRLLRSKINWEWTKECEDAFQKLKRKLCKHPLLRIPDLNKPFYIYTDASTYALGAILCQRDDDGIEYVCAFASRLLKGAELNYTITELECLAVIWAISYFHYYICGCHFTVITDHSALKWLLHKKHIQGTRLARWFYLIQDRDFTIIHRPGRLQAQVDALSRPVLPIRLVENQNDDQDSSAKVLDPYEDYALLYYLEFRKFKPGTGTNQSKRVKRAAEYYRIENDILKYRKSLKDTEYSLIIPKPELREDIVLKAHLAGHFGINTTIKNIQEKYYWKKWSELFKK